MAVNGNFLKLYNMMGNCRNLLSSRIILPIYQPVATLKRSLEKNWGLPSRPHKPPSPYIAFVKQIRPSIVAKNPDLKVVEITKILGQEWRKADEKLKSKLKEEYKQNWESYCVAKADHYKSFTEEQRLLLEKAKLEQKQSRIEKLQRKEVKDLGKPRRPSNAFTLWVRSLGAKRGSMKLSEWQKSLVPKWQALPEKERSVFEAEALKAMQEYKAELGKWEEKMIRLGKISLVRSRAKRNVPQATGKKNATE